MCALIAFNTFAGCSTNDDKLLELITDDGSVKYTVSDTRTPLSYNSFALRGLEEGVMPIGGFLEPVVTPDIQGNRIEPLNRQEVFDSIAEAGVNFIIGYRTSYESGKANESAKILLERAANAGLVTTLAAPSVISMSTGYVASPEAIADFLEELSEYPGFAGVYGRDEPDSKFFPAMKVANQNFKRGLELSGTSAFLYFNALPESSPGTMLSGDASVPITYEEYINGYLETKPQFLMFDRYPFRGEGGVVSNWFKNISIIRNKAEQNKLAWWSFTQAGGRFDNTYLHRIPTESEFLWGMNTLLAYGAKGIAHFPLSFPPEWMSSTDFSANSMIDPYGSKNAFWYYAQKGNAQVAAVDEYLMRSQQVGIVLNGESPSPVPEEDILGSGFRELKGVTGDGAIVGCFDYQGKTALYVVNNSISKDGAQIKLSFDKKYGYDIVQRGEKISVAGKQIPLTVNAGEGVLIVLR